MTATPSGASLKAVRLKRDRRSWGHETQPTVGTVGR